MDGSRGGYRADARPDAGLGTPVLAWSAFRDRRSSSSRSVSLLWRWTGTVLGTLLFLGPILVDGRLHGAVALVLSIGAGARAGRLLVRPSPAWRCADVLGRGHRALRPDRLFFLAMEPGRPRGGAGLVRARVSGTEPALDRHGHRGRQSHERLRLWEANHARAGCWAGEGITFEMACAAAPFSLPSHMTMFTGLWPFEHRARIDRPYFGPAPTLAEHLADHGYTTAGLVANTGMCNATYGLGRGFDYYADMLCNHEVSVQAAVFNSSLGRSIMQLGNRAGLPVPSEFPRGTRASRRS